MTFGIMGTEVFEGSLHYRCALPLPGEADGNASLLPTGVGRLLSLGAEGWHSGRSLKGGGGGGGGGTGAGGKSGDGSLGQLELACTMRFWLFL